jgi:alpha-beta hydrolase superfamily lysophospholipase
MGYRTAGNPKHPPVVLLHALASQSESWDEIASALASRGYWVITPDLHGHGGNDLGRD